MKDYLKELLFFISHYFKIGDDEDVDKIIQHINNKLKSLEE